MSDSAMPGVSGGMSSFFLIHVFHLTVLMILDDESYSALPLPTQSFYTIHAIPDLTRLIAFEMQQQRSTHGKLTAFGQCDTSTTLALASTHLSLTLNILKVCLLVLFVHAFSMMIQISQKDKHMSKPL